MKKILLTTISSVIIFCVEAQQQFIAKGKIEFEKKVNIVNQLKDQQDSDNSFTEMMIKSLPPNKITYHDLYFNDTKTLYKPGKDVGIPQKVSDWIIGPATDNVVFTNLETQTFSSLKTVFESTFNIQDSLQKAEWKITTADTRTIAGFECRKATTIIMDSVFVIAFYTDQILTSGGPESFSGLPGMILGLAIPRLHTTWFATKLELVDVPEAVLVAPKKGKKTNLTNLKTQLAPIMKEWGTTGQKNMWQIMI